MRGTVDFTVPQSFIRIIYVGDDTVHPKCKKIAKALINSRHKTVTICVEDNGQEWHYTAILANIFDDASLMIGYWGGGQCGVYGLNNPNDSDEIAHALGFYLRQHKDCLDAITNIKTDDHILDVCVCPLKVQSI